MLGYHIALSLLCAFLGLAGAACAPNYYGDDCTCTSDVATLMARIATTSPQTPPPTTGQYYCTQGVWTIPSFHVTVSWDINYDNIVVNGDLRISFVNLSFFLNPNITSSGRIDVLGGIAFASTSGAILNLKYPTSIPATAPPILSENLALVTLTQSYSSTNRFRAPTGMQTSFYISCYYISQSFNSWYGGTGYTLKFTRDQYCTTETAWSAPTSSVVSAQTSYDVLHDGTNYIRVGETFSLGSCSNAQQILTLSTSSDLVTWTPSSPNPLRSYCGYGYLAGEATDQNGKVAIAWFTSSPTPVSYTLYLSSNHGATFTSLAIPNPSSSTSTPYTTSLSFSSPTSSSPSLYFLLVFIDSFYLLSLNGSASTWSPPIFCSSGNRCIYTDGKYSSVIIQYSNSFLVHPTSANPILYFGFIDQDKVYVQVSIDQGKTWRRSFVGNSQYADSIKIMMIKGYPYVLWVAKPSEYSTTSGVGWRQISDDISVISAIPYNITNSNNYGIFAGPLEIRFGTEIPVQGMKSLSDTFLAASVLPGNSAWTVVQGKWVPPSDNSTDIGDLQFSLSHLLPLSLGRVNIGGFTTNTATGEYVLYWRESQETTPTLYFSKSTPSNWQTIPLLSAPKVTPGGAGDLDFGGYYHVTQRAMIGLYFGVCFVWLIVAALLYYCVLYKKINL